METGDVEAVQTRSPSDITLKYKEGLERFAQTGNPEAWWFFNDDSYIDLLRAMDLEQLQTEKILKNILRKC